MADANNKAYVYGISESSNATKHGKSADEAEINFIVAAPLDNMMENYVAKAHRSEFVVRSATRQTPSMLKAVCKRAMTIIIQSLFQDALILATSSISCKIALVFMRSNVVIELHYGLIYTGKKLHHMLQCSLLSLFSRERILQKLQATVLAFGTIQPPNCL